MGQRRRAASGPAPSTLRVVAPFGAAALVVLSLLGAALVAVQRHQAVAEAVRDARTLTEVVARDVVGSALDDAALVPGPQQDALDALVRSHVLGDRIVRVKVWDATGRVVYSDDADLVGRRFGLPEDEAAVLHSGGPPVAEVTGLDAAENEQEQEFGELLQVYLGVRTPQGTPLLFETYQPYDRIDAATDRMLAGSLPPLVGGLVLLAVLQAPLVLRMARRMQRLQEERERLLVGALAASDRERRRIAADLHDGVVQSLTGTSLSLAAASVEAQRRGDPGAAASMASTAADLRRWVRELRSLVVTVTPPALHEQGLAVSLSDLLATLEVRGTAVDLRVGGDVGPGVLDPASESLVYRVAQEAVRNIVRHAGAERADVLLERSAGGLRLEVRDHGRGFDPAAVAPRRRGSVGLELLAQLVAEQQGRLEVRSGHGQGCTVVLHLPCGPQDRREGPPARPAPPAPPAPQARQARPARRPMAGAST